MRILNLGKKPSLFSRDLFPVYAAIAAASLVLFLNLHRWSAPPDDQGPPIEKSVTGSFTGWRAVTPSPLARMETQGAVVNGKLYLLGGYYETNPQYIGSTRCDVYDPVKNTWTQIASLPHAITHAGIASDHTRYIWMAGGYPLQPTGWQLWGTVVVNVYDTVLNTWTPITPLPAARGAGAMVLLNSQLHFISGVDLSRADQATHWVLDLANPKATWVTAAPLPVARNHASSAVLNNKIYIAGGQLGPNDAYPVSTLFIYDPTTNTWTQGANMPKPRSHNSAAAFAYQDRVVVAGGETTYGQALADVIAYDPPTNKWLSLPSLPAPRHSPLIQPIGTLIVATDGANPPKLETTTWVSVGQ
jgi:N-acetylneuraminic acid mutarotase